MAFQAQILSYGGVFRRCTGKAVVSDESVARCISDIRAALRDDAGTIITTVPRRGYRFSAQVDTIAPASKREVGQPPRLSIVVLLFANLGEGPQEDHVVDGVTESLITDLSRIRCAFVISRTTAFTCKGRAVDVRQVGRGLNVRYALEGSVQRGSGRVRVNVQLVEAESGAHLWAERFDKPLADLFELQDQIVARLAHAVNCQIVAAEAQRAERTASPESMDLYFQGAARINKGETRKDIEQDRRFFERALLADPDNVAALVGLARADIIAGINGFVVDPPELLSSAEENLMKALIVVPDHPRARVLLAMLYIVTKGAQQGAAECEHALALDRNFANAHAILGTGKFFAGRESDTEGHIVEALRISPRDISAHM